MQVQKSTSLTSRFLVIPNQLDNIGDTEAYINGALEDIVTNFPPRSRYISHEALHGLWSGPTGVAYLLLHVSARKPDLTIAGQPAFHWAQCYAGGSRGHSLRLGSHGCGISDEKLALEAVRAAISKNMTDVRNFLSSVSQVQSVSEYPNEMVYGRAGTLYLLRMVRSWVPESEALVNPAIADISETIMSQGPRWRWHGRRYLGAVHGDIGIVTQLVLSTPSLAPRLQPVVERLLDMQLADGNWPGTEADAGEKRLVQFCHGAPGFVASLLSLRKYYPALHCRIDDAVAKARECIWSQGLLKKEPNLCHGIFGNALTLPLGPRRDHFLVVATPDYVARMKSSDPTGTIFERADYGRPYSALTSYAPCAAWAWMVCGEEEPLLLSYNDL